MQVEVSQASPVDVDADLVVVGLFEGGELPAGLADAPGAGDVKGAFKKATIVYPEKPEHALAIGLGRREDLDPERLRVAAALAASTASSLDAGSIAWSLDGLGGGMAAAIVE